MDLCKAFVSLSWTIAGNKHTIVIVLHQTNEPSPVIPTTREYGREGVILVDVIFSEDRGLLSGQINTEAFKKAASYLKEHASVSMKKNEQFIGLQCLLFNGHLTQRKQITVCCIAGKRSEER